MTDIKNEEASEKKSLNFIEQAVENDLKAGFKLRTTKKADKTGIKNGAVKKVPKKKGCDLAKKQDSSLFLWYN